MISEIGFFGILCFCVAILIILSIDLNIVSYVLLGFGSILILIEIYLQIQEKRDLKELKKKYNYTNKIAADENDNGEEDDFVSTSLNVNNYKFDINKNPENSDEINNYNFEEE